LTFPADDGNGANGRALRRLTVKLRFVEAHFFSALDHSAATMLSVSGREQAELLLLVDAGFGVGEVNVPAPEQRGMVDERCVFRRRVGTQRDEELRDLRRQNRMR
jgi:hypothetical protein